MACGGCGGNGVVLAAIKTASNVASLPAKPAKSKPLPTLRPKPTASITVKGKRPIVCQTCGLVLRAEVTNKSKPQARCTRCGILYKL